MLFKRPTVADACLCFCQVLEGVSLQAEVLQFAEDLPSAFHLDAKSSLSSVLFDYKYLKNPAAHEQKLSSSKTLVALDEECQQVCMVYLRTYEQR